MSILLFFFFFLQIPEICTTTKISVLCYFNTEILYILSAHKTSFIFILIQSPFFSEKKIKKYNLHFRTLYMHVRNILFCYWTRVGPKPTRTKPWCSIYFPSFDMIIHIYFEDVEKTQYTTWTKNKIKIISIYMDLINILFCYILYERHVSVPSPTRTRPRPLLSKN